jgi:hypothetical protein
MMPARVPILAIPVVICGIVVARVALSARVRFTWKSSSRPAVTRDVLEHTATTRAKIHVVTAHLDDRGTG